MIFTFYTINLYPYGANIEVFILDTNYDIEFAGRSDLIISQAHLCEIKYGYRLRNGELVEIDTNLILVDWDKSKKTFTVKNDNIFGDKNTKPYINLKFNNVYIDTYFEPIYDKEKKHWNLSHWDSHTITNDYIELRGGPGQSDHNQHSVIRMIRKFPISWSTSTEIQPFTLFENWRYDYRETHFRCDAYYTYIDENNKIVPGQKTLINTWSGRPKGYITIPKLNGELNTLKYDCYDANEDWDECSDFDPGVVTETKRFINYFYLGFLIRVYSGYGIQSGYSVPYVYNAKFYEKRGFIKQLNDNKKYYLTNKAGIPSLTSSLGITWGNEYFYSTVSTYEYNDGKLKYESPYYISPSTSQIYSDFIIQKCSKDYHCGDKGNCTECYDCENQGCQEGGCGEGNSCPSDSGGGTTNPWDTEKQWVGGYGYSYYIIRIYDAPQNGKLIASIAPYKSFSVYYYWKGWYQIFDGWINGNTTDWMYEDSPY